MKKSTRQRQRPVGLRLGVGLAAVAARRRGRRRDICGWSTSGLGDSRRSSMSLTSACTQRSFIAMCSTNGRCRFFASLDAVLDIGAVIGDRAVDVGAAAHQVAELAAEAVADRADLAVALRNLLQIVPGVLHVAHAEVVVELVIEIERLLHVIGIVVGQLDARLLPPEQVRHEADEAGLGELVGVLAHGVVDAPDFHDGDDRAGGRLVRIGEIGAHLAVAQLHPDVSGSACDSPYREA